MSDRRTALYRHFNAANELLYVGISLSSVDRLSRHIRHSVWAYDITRIEISWLSDRKSALLAEKNAIDDESPKFNKYHSDKFSKDHTAPIGWRDASKFYDDSGSLVFELKESMIDGLGYFSRCQVKWNKPPKLKMGLLLASIISSRTWNNKKCSIDVDVLRSILNIEEKYSHFGNIKSKIINPAIIEIKDCSNMRVSYELLKVGRKVMSVKFTFDFKPGIDHKEVAKIEALSAIEGIKSNLRNTDAKYT